MLKKINKTKERLDNFKETHSKLLLMCENTESNLIKSLENIDGGDVSKEMFDNVRNYQTELRINLKEIDQHLDNYIQLYGIENK